MKKTLLTLIMLCIVFLAHAQNVDTMYVYNIDGSVHKFEVEKIERIAFIISKTTFSQKSKRSVQNQAKSQNETVVKNSNTQA